MRSIRFLKFVFKHYPTYIVITISVMLASGLFEAMSLLSLAPLIEVFLHRDLEGMSSVTRSVASVLEYLHLPITLWVMLGVFLSLNVLKTLFVVLSRYLIFWTTTSIHRDMALKTYIEVFNSNWWMFASDKQGRLLNTFSREIPMTAQGLVNIGYFISDMVLLAFCLIVPLYFSWRVTLIALAAGGILATPLLMAGRINYRLGKRTTEQSNQMASILQENLTSAKVILGFGNQEQSLQSLRTAIEGYCRASLHSSTLRSAIPVLYNPCGIFAVILSLYAAELVGVSLPETGALLYSLMKCIPYAGSLSHRKNTIDYLSPSFEQVQKVRKRSEDLVQKTGLKMFKGFTEQILLDSVSFAYPGHAPILKEITINIPKGCMIGLVGPSGAGKTSIIDALLGFNEPSSGQVLIDGTPLYDYDIVSYRKMIGYVPQETALFNNSIYQNILWANPRVSFTEIQQACDKANASEFIERLPERYDTLIGDRGVRLSGGQCQRLALARALVRQPVLLILDEATSSLDSHSEQLIQKAIESLAESMTVIVIAHRLSTITRADYIYVVESGEIAEEGTYQDLVEKAGSFEKMLRLQVGEKL